MTRKKSAVTAAELVARLADDKAYQAKVEAGELRANAVAEAEAEVVRALAEIGLHVSVLADLRHSGRSIGGAASRVLLDYLTTARHPRVQEEIVRCLPLFEERSDLTPVYATFKTTQSESLRWAIANAVAELRPLDAKEWIIGTLQEQSYGRARELLPLALARVAPNSEANEVLLPLFEQMPGHVALAFAESGGQRELDVLLERSASKRGWVKKEIERAIRAIRSRMKA